MSALLSFSERKTFARCFDKSLAARLRCLSDLLGVGGAARSLFPKNFGYNPHFSGALFNSLRLGWDVYPTCSGLVERHAPSSQKISGKILNFSGALHMSVLLSFKIKIIFTSPPWRWLPVATAYR